MSIMKSVGFLTVEDRNKTWTRQGLLSCMISVITCSLSSTSSSRCKMLKRPKTLLSKMRKKTNFNWLSNLKRLQDHHEPQLIFLTNSAYQNFRRVSKNQSQLQNNNLLFLQNKRNLLGLLKNHHWKAALNNSNNTVSKSIPVSNRSKIQRTTRPLALNKLAVVDLTKSERMKTQEPSRFNSSNENNSNQRAASLSIMTMNMKVKVTRKMSYPRSSTNKCTSKSPITSTIKHLTQKATHQKSLKK